MSLFDEITSALLNPGPGARIVGLLLGAGGEESLGGPDDARDESIIERESASAWVQATPDMSFWCGTFGPVDPQDAGWRYGSEWGGSPFTTAAFYGEPGYVVGVDPDLYADQTLASGNILSYTAAPDLSYPDAPSAASTPEIDDLRRRLFGDPAAPGPLNLNGSPQPVAPPSDDRPTVQGENPYGDFRAERPSWTPPATPTPPTAAGPPTPRPVQPAVSLPPLPPPAPNPPAPSTDSAPAAAGGPNPAAPPLAPPPTPLPAPPLPRLAWGPPLVRVDGVGDVSLLRFALTRPGTGPTPTAPAPAPRVQPSPPAPTYAPSGEPSNAAQSLLLLLTAQSTLGEQWQRSKLRSNLQDVWEQIRRAGASLSHFGEFGSARQAFVSSISPVPLPGVQPPPHDDPESAEWERGEKTAGALMVAEALGGFVGPGAGPGPRRAPELSPVPAAGPRALPDLSPAPGATPTIPLPTAPLAPPVLFARPTARRTGPGWSGASTTTLGHHLFAPPGRLWPRQVGGSVIQASRAGGRSPTRCAECSAGTSSNPPIRT